MVSERTAAAASSSSFAVSASALRSEAEPPAYERGLFADGHRGGSWRCPLHQSVLTGRPPQSGLWDIADGTNLASHRLCVPDDSPLCLRDQRCSGCTAVTGPSQQTRVRRAPPPYTGRDLRSMFFERPPGGVRSWRQKSGNPCSLHTFVGRTDRCHACVPQAHCRFSDLRCS